MKLQLSNKWLQRSKENWALRRYTYFNFIDWEEIYNEALRTLSLYIIEALGARGEFFEQCFRISVIISFIVREANACILLKFLQNILQCSTKKIVENYPLNSSPRHAPPKCSHKNAQPVKRRLEDYKLWPLISTLVLWRGLNFLWL